MGYYRPHQSLEFSLMRQVNSEINKLDKEYGGHEGNLDPEFNQDNKSDNFGGVEEDNDSDFNQDKIPVGSNFLGVLSTPSVQISINEIGNITKVFNLTKGMVVNIFYIEIKDNNIELVNKLARIKDFEWNCKFNVPSCTSLILDTSNGLNSSIERVEIENIRCLETIK